MIDDNEPARQFILQYMHNYFAGQYSLVFEADCCRQGLRALQSHQIDLLFLDLELGDGSGMDILDALPTITFAVVFFSSHTELAVETIAYLPLGFLPKPVTRQKFKEVIQFALQNTHRTAINQTMRDAHDQTRVQNSLSRIFEPYPYIISVAGEKLTVFTNNILYCKAHDTYAEFFFANNSKPLMVSKPLGKIEEELEGKGFARCHKSYILNLAHIRTILFKDRKHIAVLTNNDEVPIGLHFVPLVRHAYIQALRPQQSLQQ